METADTEDGARTKGRYTLYAWHLSYFSGKTRAYLRYKGIDFVERPIDFYTLMWRIPRHVGARVMPVVVTPQGEWLQDTTIIWETLESRYPHKPVVPATPGQRMTALLIEAWADEWWIPIAMHYRWSYPENYGLFEYDAGNALLPGFPRLIKRRAASRIANTLRSYLPTVGICPEQQLVLERWTNEMLDALDAHFGTMPFLFGDCPSIADFALLGPIYAHLARDPWPRRHLIEPRLRLKAWIERMNEPNDQSGEFLPQDRIPQTLRPILTALFREFYPMLGGIQRQIRDYLDNANDRSRILPRGLGQIRFPMGQGSFARAAMPYSLWMMQRAMDHYAELTEDQQRDVDEALSHYGADGTIHFSSDFKLERRGLRVAVV